jgi:hypothetical protein
MSSSLAIPASMTLGAYRPPEVRVECLRCQRIASPKTAALRKRFGDGTTVIEAARLLAQEGVRPCGLAAVEGGKRCGVGVSAPPVWTYATLYDALHGGWRAFLICRRHLEALKRGRPCPGDIELDIPTLAAALGHDFKLQRLFGKCECPKCHTDVIDIQWAVPDPAAPPHAPATSAPVLRFRPTRGEKAQRTLLAIRGGKAVKG